MTLIPLSRTEFATDAAYQTYNRRLFQQLGLDDGYSYAVSLATGRIQRGGKLKTEVEKPAKSHGEDHPH